MRTDRLDWQQSVAALRELEGREVAVRIALQDRNEGLVAVFHAELGEPGPHPEQPGLYLDKDDFVAGERRAGGIVVINRHDVIVNVRPLRVEDT